MKNASLVILAAGMGSRYGGLKQLDGVGPSGETIMDYSIYDAIKAGFNKIIFVIKESFRADFEKRVKERYGNAAQFVFVAQELHKIPEGYKLSPQREKPWGTGHAMLMAAEAADTPFAVINADDYYGQESFGLLYKFLTNKASAGKYCMIGFELGNTLSESGSVSRGVCTASNDNYLLSVEEHHNIARNGVEITGTNSAGNSVNLQEHRAVSMNMWGFFPDIFTKGEIMFKEFLSQKGEELKSEFYIPSVVNNLLTSGEASVELITTPDEWFGVTYKEDRDSVVAKIAELVKEGLYPSPLFTL